MAFEAGNEGAEGAPRSEGPYRRIFPKRELTNPLGFL